MIAQLTASPIDEEALSRVGFVRRRGLGGYPEFVRDVRDPDMDEGEWSVLIFTRGNGTDRDCWDVRFTRRDINHIRPLDSVMLRYGLKWEWQIANLIAVFG